MCLCGFRVVALRYHYVFLPNRFMVSISPIHGIWYHIPNHHFCCITCKHLYQWNDKTKHKMVKREKALPNKYVYIPLQFNNNTLTNHQLQHSTKIILSHRINNKAWILKATIWNFSYFTLLFHSPIYTDSMNIVGNFDLEKISPTGVLQW